MLEKIFEKNFGKSLEKISEKIVFLWNWAPVQWTTGVPQLGMRGPKNMKKKMMSIYSTLVRDPGPGRETTVASSPNVL